MNKTTQSAEASGARNESGNLRDFGPITVCILGASFQTGNLGVSALAAGSVTAVLSAYPDARVVFMDYGIVPAVCEVRYPAGISSIELVNIRFSKKFYLRNNIARLLLQAFWAKFLPPRYRARVLSRNNAYLDAIADSHIIAAISGGGQLQ